MNLLYRTAIVLALFQLVRVSGSLVSIGMADDFQAISLKPKQGLKPFEYLRAEGDLPNYLPNAKWGTQGEAIRTMQKPLSAAESLEHVVLPDGFEARLFASEHDIVKAICMAWDERGRLWIAETIDYPNELQKSGEGRDRIKICEDKDGDGRADKFTVFAEKLSIPTGMVFANGGLIVIEGGHALFLKDTDGDNKADVRRVLFEGWKMNDTHATASNLRWGFDNWIWGVVGYSGFDGEIGGKRMKFGMGVYRFKPDGSEIEYIRASNNNTWGLGFSEEGIVFGSTANDNASWYMPIPNRYYESVNGRSAARMETIADSQRIYPITEKVRQVDWHGRYTAGAGHALYTARQFPKQYWNRIAFVTEPTGHLIGHFALEAKGADFVAHNLHSFMASDDEWCAPVVAEVGPDGAVWVSDWYNYIVQHNPTPVGFQTGKGNAYETSLRDKKHGRIYRVISSGPKISKPSYPDLAKATSTELVETLKSDNLLWRQHAQRLLVERGNKEIVPLLAKLISDKNVDEIGLNTAAIHALSVLDGLGAMNEKIITTALKHPSAGVRRTAASVLPRTDDSAKQLLANEILQDTNTQVRLAAFLAIADCPSANGSVAGEALYAALKRPENASDRWIRDALTSAAVQHRDEFLRALLADSTALPDGASNVLRIFAHDYASRVPEDFVQTLALLKKISATTAASLVEGFSTGWPKNRAPQLNANDREQLEKLIRELSPEVRERLLVLGRRWNISGLFESEFAVMTKQLQEEIGDPKRDDDARLGAAKKLLNLADTGETARLILAQINWQSSPSFAAGLLSIVAESRQTESGREIISSWSRLTPAARRVAMSTLLRRNEWVGLLLDALEKNEITRGDFSAEHWLQLEGNRDSNIAARARKFAVTAGVVSADRQEILTKLLPVADQKGDAARGHEVFKSTCAVCHKFNGEGASVGPELTGIAARPRKDILVEILDPNRSVEANYRLWTATTKSGDSFSGRLESETQTSVEILDLTSVKHVIERKEIATLEESKLSIMPVGFESLPETDLAALLEFLTQDSHPEKK